MFNSIHARPWPGVFILILLIAGCAATPQSRFLLQQAPAELPRQMELHATPFFPQQAYQCGPAALATVLSAQGTEVEPDELVAKVYIPKRRGSLQAEMVSAARGYGMMAYPLAPNLGALLAEIAAGNPVLVFQNLGLDWLPRWHYAVAIGYDLNAGELVLRSGTTERRITPLATFERTWRRAGYWAQVILPPGHLPATAKPLPYLKAVHALETSGKEQLALNAYRVAVAEWPEDPSVLMAWGNAEYGAGYLQQAETAFHRVITLQPRAADAWNNLAYVLAARQCGREVRQAIECAMTLAPGDENIRDSARELLQQELGQEGKCMLVQCPVR